MEPDLIQAFSDLAGSPVPAGSRLFGGGSDAAAELMDGSRVPSAPSYVYLSPASDAVPADEVWVYDPDALIWHQAADSQVYSDERGILQVFAIPGNPYRVWVDFGAGRTGMAPVDTHHELTQHMDSPEAHADIRIRIEALQAEVDAIDGQVAELDEINLAISDLQTRTTEAESNANTALSTSTQNTTRVDTLDQRVTTLEGNTPCLRMPLMWDMSGTLGSSVSRHRYTNLHDHLQEVTLFYAEIDVLQGGNATVRLLERDRDTGQTTELVSGELTPTSRTFVTTNFLHVLQEGKQIVPEVIMGEGAEGLDLTFEVYVQ
ncbi:hypothetical protein AB0I72_26700 [Nocardiopsis sp. NPDC049922]|uniref:hypothetical protein n=1 Tax=Nocardiopsis sp. NPDC049922 TaxID=3155157 RepID=UPI0033DF9313